MGKGKMAHFFARLLEFHIEFHILPSLQQSPSCCTKSLSHGTQGMGLAREGEEVGWKVYDQISSPDGVITSPRSTITKDMGKVLAVELNSLSTKTPGILGSCCLSRCSGSH